MLSSILTTLSKSNVAGGHTSYFFSADLSRDVRSGAEGREESSARKRKDRTDRTNHGRTRMRRIEQTFCPDQRPDAGDEKKLRAAGGSQAMESNYLANHLNRHAAIHYINLLLHALSPPHLRQRLSKPPCFTEKSLSILDTDWREKVAEGFARPLADGKICCLPGNLAMTN